MKWLTLVFAFIFLLSGCRTTRMVSTEVRTHDTAFVYRDSIIYRLVKDSLSEREKTVIQTKHDTVNNVDTVFVTTERERVRIIQKQDTAYITKYVYRAKDGNETKEKTKGGDNLRTIVFFVSVIFFVIAVIGIARTKKQ